MQLIAPKPTILLGVTADMSLGLMRGFPAYLVEQKWDVHVVSSPGPELDALAAVDGVTTHALQMAREPAPFSDLRALVAWIGLLRRIRPDLLSVGTPKAGLLGGVAGRLARVPHRVYLLRGIRLETSVGIARRVFTLLERLSVDSAQIVLAVSPSLRQRAIDLRLVRSDRVVVLGSGSSNGVDLELFDQRKFTQDQRADLALRLGLVPGVPVVGFVGRLTRDKGLAVLAEARTILATAGIDHQLLVVGGVDGAHGNEKFDGWSGTVRPAIVTGHVSDPETYYQAMDLLCLPTLREGFPNVVLEAAAGGIPTVTTTATGAIDSVIDGDTGLLAEAGSPTSLAGQLSLLLTDGDRRRAMGTRATEHVSREFGRPQVMSLTEKFYRDVIAATHTTKKGTI